MREDVANVHNLTLGEDVVADVKVLITERNSSLTFGEQPGLSREAERNNQETEQKLWELAGPANRSCHSLGSLVPVIYRGPFTEPFSTLRP